MPHRGYRKPHFGRVGERTTTLSTTITKKNSAELESKPWFLICTKIIVPFLVPISIGLLGFFTTSYLKQKELLETQRANNEKFLQIAISILQTNPKDGLSGQGEVFRKWAIGIFDSCSPIKLTQGAKRILAGEPLKGVSGWNDDGEYTTLTYCPEGLCWSSDSMKCVECFENKDKR